jgi:hypothetical protein
MNGILKTALSAITLADLSRDEGSTRAWLLSSATRADEARHQARTESARAAALPNAADLAAAHGGREQSQAGRKEVQP